MAKLDGLHPYVKQKTEELIRNANARLTNHKMMITQAFRSKAEQDALYAQGRTKPGAIVTNAKGGTSMHNFGLAIDFCLVTPDGKRTVWDVKGDFDKDGVADWMEVVEEAKKLGFTWGGDWTSFVDMPHFQMLGGLTESQVRAGKQPSFVKADTRIMWGKTELKKGQIGKITIILPINLWKRNEDLGLEFVRVLQPGEEYRVYRKDELYGGQYNVGGGHWITDMEGYIKYETPSKAKLAELEKRG